MATATGTTRTASAHRRTEPLRLPRTTGALSGLLVIVLGVWGGLIPFIGPYFHFAFGGYQTWHYTTQRLWLDIIPGAVAVIGGFMLLTSTSRSGGLLGGWLAVAAGIWFAIGPPVSMLWHHTFYAIGTPAGGHVRQMLEWIGFFYGTGVAIVGLSAFAMGRYFSRPRLAEEAGVVAAGAAAAEAERRHERHEERHEPMTRAAVAEAPAERAAYRDEEAYRDEAAYRDEGAYPYRDAPADRAAAEDVPAERAAYQDEAPAEHGAGPGADAPTERAAVADAPATETPATSTSATDTRAADAPGAGGPSGTTAVPTSTGTAGAAGPTTATTRRRSGGLLGRFRR